MAKSFVFAAAVGFALGSSLQMAYAIDWLGQCEEGDELIDKVEQPGQNCAGLFNCDDAVPDNSSCLGPLTPRPCFEGSEELVQYGRRRVIQVGDCEARFNTDKCWYCKESDLVCVVAYRYADSENGICQDRCSKPFSYVTQSGEKCKP